MKNARDKLTISMAIALMILATGLRLQPHLANSTPFFAISLLIGFLLGSGRSALASMIAVSAMLLSDLVLGFHATMVFVYVGIALAATLGSLFSNVILRQPSFLRRAGVAFMTSAFASLVFFIVSNLGVWLVGGIYDRTIEGLSFCFLMAIPFFKTSFAVDVLFGTTFVLVAARLLANSFPAFLASPSATAKVNHGR